MDVGQCFGVMRLQGPQNNVHKSFAEAAEGCARELLFFYSSLSLASCNRQPQKNPFFAAPKTH